jgi:hypothetical protein
MGKQDNAPFKFLVRPLTTVHVRSKNLSRAFEEEVFASFVNVEFSPPISGILILPIIVDDAIAVPPPDTYAYDGDRLVLRGGLSTHKHVFKSELKSD